MVHLFAICLLAYVSTHLNDPDQTTLTIVIKSRGENSNSQAPAVTGNSSKVDENDVQPQEEPIALPVINAQNDNDEDSSDPKDKIIFDVRTTEYSRPRGLGYYWTSYVLSDSGSPIVSQRDLNLVFLLGCITVAISLMLLVGIVKGKPAYLVPFLTYQIMDLLASCLTVAGFICYGPEIKDYILSDPDLRGLDSQWVTLLAALVVLGVVFIKAYFVQIVWLCIRYLKEESLRRAREECQPKVIYLDSTTDPELSVFVFDDNGNIVKNTPPPPTYDNISDEQKTAPPAYTPTANA